MVRRIGCYLFQAADRLPCSTDIMVNAWWVIYKSLISFSGIFQKKLGKYLSRSCYWRCCDIKNFKVLTHGMSTFEKSYEEMKRFSSVTSMKGQLDSIFWMMTKIINLIPFFSLILWNVLHLNLCSGLYCSHGNWLTGDNILPKNPQRISHVTTLQWGHYIYSPAGPPEWN